MNEINLNININDIERFKNVRMVLEDFADSFVSLYKSKVSNSNASKNLYNSIEKIIEINNNGQNIQVCLSLAHYWVYVEQGRKKGSRMPPIASIEEWIRVKPVIPDDRTGKVPSEKQLAFLIARSIKEKGIEGKKYYAETFEELWSIFSEKLYEAIDKDVDDIATVILKEYVEANMQDYPKKYQKLY